MTITIYGIKNCDTMKKARAWLFFVTGRFCQERLENRPDRLFRGGICRQYTALGKVQA